MSDDKEVTYNEEEFKELVYRIVMEIIEQLQEDQDEEIK